MRRHWTHGHQSWSGTAGSAAVRGNSHSRKPQESPVHSCSSTCCTVSRASMAACSRKEEKSTCSAQSPVQL